MQMSNPVIFCDPFVRCITTKMVGNAPRIK
jgi:hypothetical protein